MHIRNKPRHNTDPAETVGYSEPYTLNIIKDSTLHPSAQPFQYQFKNITVYAMRCQITNKGL